MDKPLTKTQTLSALAENTGLTKQQVTSVLDELGNLIVASVATGGPGSFTIPSLMKVKVVRKPAEPEREGINPFTKEPTTFKAKPARNVVKITALKALKDRV